MAVEVESPAGPADVAAKMEEDAASLESTARTLAGFPLVAEAYSECVAILRDGATRVHMPLPPLE